MPAPISVDSVFLPMTCPRIAPPAAPIAAPAPRPVVFFYAPAQAKRDAKIIRTEIAETVFFIDFPP
jgi:hypothetical protein